MLNIVFPFVESAFQPKKKQVSRLPTPHILGFASSEDFKIAEIAIKLGPPTNVRKMFAAGMHDSKTMTQTSNSQARRRET